MLQRIAAFALAVPLAATALVMMFAPRSWYDGFPGVMEKGPFNPHFVRDLGSASLVAAGVFLAFAVMRRPPVSALIATAAFISLHALVHTAELFAMTDGVWSTLLRDLPAVHLPAVLAIWLAASAVRQSRTGPETNPVHRA